MRQRTAEEGPAFGKVTTTRGRAEQLAAADEKKRRKKKADFYLLRLSVMLQKRKTAKVQGIVQRARDTLIGGAVGTFDE